METITEVKPIEKKEMSAEGQVRHLFARLIWATTGDLRLVSLFNGWDNTLTPEEVLQLGESRIEKIISQHSERAPLSQQVVRSYQWDKE